MRPNWYALISRALEEGVKSGFNHAHKHTDIPEVDDIQDAIVDAQLANLDEIFIFDEQVSSVPPAN